jgi:error-prone DNA polymerase
MVWDIVRYAVQHGIRCQGRGSAANSLVAYLLNISPIDPIAHGLVFERFLSDERAVTPDIDIDFEAGDRREEVIQYAYQRYGIDRAAMACTLVTFRARSALREVGKALGFPLPVLAGVSKILDTRDARNIPHSASLQEYLGAHSSALPWRQLMQLCGQIAGFPRHLGIHNGGLTITGSLLAERVPTEPATMVGRSVIQWDKESLEEVGLIKIDLLGLRMLSAIAEAIRIIEATTGQPLDLDKLTFDDPTVFDMICQADTLGVFQVESRAQAQVLPRLRPRTFQDLIVSISLIRPGPIQGNMVHPYLRRRLGTERVTYPHALLKPALEETLGVILFQEQVLKVARDLSGFTAGQGEQLRRALGSKQGQEQVGRFETAFVQGAQVKKVSRSTAEAVFGKLRAFGSYSFRATRSLETGVRNRGMRGKGNSLANCVP